MAAGSKWELFIPAHLAYGENARSKVIGPNSTLLFEVELISIQGKKIKSFKGSLNYTDFTEGCYLCNSVYLWLLF